MDSLYGTSLSLLTDLYELTMAYGYWKAGRGEQEAVFNLFFRKPPFKGGYALACGLEPALEFLQTLRFTDDDLAYLAELKGSDDQPLFEVAFLDYLRDMRFSCDVDAIPEGTVVFGNEPLVRIQGPILQAQIIETALLTILNFQTLIATKAARVCQSAQGEPVLEFGLRRAQGIDGGISASRAAYIGGCAATSNVLAGKRYGIPVKGTHAHSWVMSFDSEAEAFAAYARALPNNCIFLVDTYNTLEGVQHAIEAGKRLREAGHEMNGIRLDSGDLAYLSIEARRMLDEAGFPKASIVASNDLDEYLIRSLKDQDAAITVWGVGTNLVTAYDQPALGGVYKLAALRRNDGTWEPKIKLSEQTIKVNNPGRQQVRRYRNDRGFAADMIYDLDAPPAADQAPVIIDPNDITRRKRLSPETPSEELLVPVMRAGKLVYPLPSLSDVRQRAHQQLASLHPTIKRFENPHLYPVGLEEAYYQRKLDLILKMKAINT
ncbi:nicotinate phosphoribosyltransferase [Catalinimonas alkaloidigena]|uniref:Nicotinate phosphoribosyltransferase n=1 Tax=Catalinimonas alkaloidigena TaxID=1075417 RepID=A0A1G9AW29_9BACT|nr:nicotinate phosphoribosyltransferase [Catalinimonas alkaloidigena]SDK31447.1 nicotinate phosphoribosyltransferase [Catalinimonas alkaloidigena]